jgi:hypothetical protein
MNRDEALRAKRIGKLFSMSVFTPETSLGDLRNLRINRSETSAKGGRSHE